MLSDLIRDNCWTKHARGTKVQSEASSNKLLKDVGDGLKRCTNRPPEVGGSIINVAMHSVQCSTGSMLITSWRRSGLILMDLHMFTSDDRRVTGHALCVTMGFERCTTQGLREGGHDNALGHFVGDDVVQHVTLCDTLTVDDLVHDGDLSVNVGVDKVLKGHVVLVLDISQVVCVYGNSLLTRLRVKSKYMYCRLGGVIMICVFLQRQTASMSPTRVFRCLRCMGETNLGISK